jgi:sugar O-acyltransferase (sialic acid O-acetyltransferase NeuD family)
MKKIILIGGGGHCKSVIDVIEQEAKYEIVGIVDKPELCGSKVFNYKVIGSDDDLVPFAKKYNNALITVGQIENSNLRKQLFKSALKAGFSFPSIISPLSYVSKHAKIGYGTVVMHDALINAGAVVGNNCIINSKALLEHGVFVDDFCHISTNAVVNGDVTVGKGTFFGSGSTSKEGITIAKNTFVPAGDVVK